ncbi:hypothetical protein YC2023_027655 [Brassica napus]
MEEQLKTLIKVWVSAIICISYCYYFPSRIKAGLPRLFSVLPICALFGLLPLFFSSIHLSGSTALFFSGVGNLKLILFCFDQGPLYPLPSNLFKFVCYTCFPVKLEQNPKSQNRFPKCHISSRFLGAAMEPHGLLHSPDRSLPSREASLRILNEL